VCGIEVFSSCDVYCFHCIQLKCKDNRFWISILVFLRQCTDALLILMDKLDAIMLETSKKIQALFQDRWVSYAMICAQNSVIE